MVRLTIQNTLKDEFFPVEIDDNGKVEDIKVMICAEKGTDVDA